MDTDDKKNQKPISPARAAKEYLLSQIRKIAAAANVGISPETVAVYAAELAKLSQTQLDSAVARTISEWPEASKLPPLKFILDRAGDNAKLLAEQAWELAWKLVKRDWYSDGIGWVNGSDKKLTAAMQYAIRACGGEYRMAYSTEEEFPFIRKDFLVAHERFALEGGDQVRLTHAEAVGLLDKIRREELPE